MTSKLRVIFDTNAMISALLKPHSTPFQAFQWAYHNAMLLQSSATLAELGEVVSRPKFDRYITPAERLAFLEQVRAHATLIDVTSEIADCRDPKDNKFLELAVDGRAQIIVSGDKDLLDLNPYRDVVILTPDEFLRASRTET